MSLMHLCLSNLIVTSNFLSLKFENVEHTHVSNPCIVVKTMSDYNRVLPTMHEKFVLANQIVDATILLMIKL